MNLEEGQTKDQGQRSLRPFFEANRVSAVAHYQIFLVRVGYFSFPLLSTLETCHPQIERFGESS
jgi:hypothetical protein